MIRQQFRNNILNTRKNLTPTFCDLAAKQVANNLIKADLLNKSNNIALYLAVKNELNLQPIIQYLWQQNKNCYLPVLNGSQNGLLFIKYSKNDILINNKVGIPEPVYEKTNSIDAIALDLVLTPLVGFDIHGNRLGMGGGYYDRTFAFKNIQPKNTKPILVGVGYEFQKIQSITNESWDVALDFIVTEENIYFAN